MKSSATGVFGTIAKEPVKAVEEKPVAGTPLVAVPAEKPSSAGFTQLLRALNYEGVKTAPAAMPVVAPVEHTTGSPEQGGPMTQLLRTLSSGNAEAGASEKPAYSPGSSQVTSFLPGSAPVMPAAAPAPVPAGSFTQLFARLEEPSKAVEPEKSVSAASSTQLSASPDLPVAPVKVAEPEPASLTQLFAGMSVENVGKSEVALAEIEVVPAAITASRAALAPVSAIHEAAPAKNLAPAIPVKTPGSFTQMFQTVSAPAAEPGRPATSQAADLTEAAPAPATMLVEPTGESPLSAPVSFTQMFQALETSGAGEPRYEPPPMVEASPKDAVSSPGSFTQMFRTLDEEPKAHEPAKSEAPSSPLAPIVSPVPSPYGQTLTAPVPESEGRGVSQVFATYREPQATSTERSREFSPTEPAPARMPVTTTPSSGGLTQLLQALDRPAPSVKPYAAPGSAQSGPFTGVYDELGTSPAAAAPVAPSVAAPSPVGAGPSEFTRLIDASALREAALRRGERSPHAPSISAAASSGNGGGFAIPSGLPGGAHASFGVPTAPSASLSGPAGVHASASAAGGGHASFTAPHLPTISAAPTLKMPGMSKAAGTPAGMQKYLPLLLILVIFLLLAVLVAVVVLMKK